MKFIIHTDTTNGLSESLLTGIVAGSTVVVTLLVVVPVGILIGMEMAWTGCRNGRDPASKTSQRKEEETGYERSLETTVTLMKN